MACCGLVPTGELQTSGNIFGFEIRQFFKDLLLGEAGCEQVEYVDDSNPHPADTGPPTTLSGVDGDPFHEFCHDGCLLNG